MEYNVQLIRKRNKLMVKLLWVFLTLDIVFNLFLLNLSPLKVHFAVGIPFILVLTYLVFRKQFDRSMMFVIVLSIFTYFFVMIHWNPVLVSFIYIWFGLLLTSIFQDVRAVLLGGALTAGLTIYFYNVYSEEIFPFVKDQDAVFLTLFGVFFTIFLVVNGRFTENLREQAEDNKREAVEAKREIENLLSYIKKSSDDKIRHLSSHDELTGLPNQKYFREKLSIAITEAKQAGTKGAILMFDLDRFKAINDSFGYTVADRLLKIVSAKLKATLAKEVCLSRLGGSDFIILIPRGNEPAATAMAQQITSLFQQSIWVGDHEIFTSANIGICLFPQNGEHVDQLMKHAETAKFYAGKNKEVFKFYQTSMDEMTSRRMMIELSLRRALEREEFEVHYQPKMNLATGEIFGMEALIRWNHPILGNIPPMEFIALAEEIGLIHPMGEWILRSACSQTKAWQRAGHNQLRVSVNLSLRQFQDVQLVERIRGILEETGLHPKFLELEITETIAMNDWEGVYKKLDELGRLGIHISLDDFGTGFSSLSYLNKLPLNTLKIDKSFITDIGENHSNSAVVNAIISMAKNLNLNTIAEGVENASQRAILGRMGCNEIQGYLISKPLRSDEFERVMLRRLAN